VPGLKARPSTAIDLVLYHPQFVLDLLHQVFALGLVDALHFLQQFKVVTEVVGDVHEGIHVLREAGTAVADARAAGTPGRCVCRGPCRGHLLHVSAPASSQKRLTALTKEIFIARNELEACLVSSALAMFMTRKGQPVFLMIGS
jgi:hypothetical protein